MMPDSTGSTFVGGLLRSSGRLRRLRCSAADLLGLCRQIEVVLLHRDGHLRVVAEQCAMMLDLPGLDLSDGRAARIEGSPKPA